MKNIFLLLFLIFLAEIATDIYVPVLPLFTSVFDTNLEIIQLTMSLHLLGFALGQLFYGPLSDYYGRKKTLFVGFAIFVTATLMCAFSRSIQMLIFFRFIQGFGACVAPVIGMTIIKDLYTEKTANIKMLSVISMTVSLSPIIGPILGTMIAEYSGWKGSFYLLSMCGMILLPFLYFHLNETHRQPCLPQIQTKSVVFPFIGHVLINALTVSCVWVFITVAPFILMQIYHVPLLHYGYYQAFTVMVYMLGGLFTHRFIAILDQKKISFIGLFIICIGSFGLLFFWCFLEVTKNSFIGFIALMECGIGIFRPVIVNQIMDYYPRRSGFSAAVLGTTEMLISALAIGVLGLFQQGVIEVSIGIFTIAILMALMIYIFLYFIQWNPKNTVRVFTNTQGTDHSI